MVDPALTPLIGVRAGPQGPPGPPGPAGPAAPASSILKSFRGSATTDAQGNVTFTYPDTGFTEAPIVVGQLGPISDTATYELRLLSATETACTFNVRKSLSKTTGLVSHLLPPVPAVGVTVQCVAIRAGSTVS